ncbi:MAG: hypothetical protein ACRCZI_02590 [Cetobacterium sp.]
MSENQQVENPVDPQEEERKIIKSIEALSLEYNASLDDLGEIEILTQEIENKMFKIFLDQRKNPKANEETKDEYDAVFMELVEIKQDFLQKQSRSFRLLQKFRNLHVGYLQNVNVALANKIRELSPVAVAGSSEPAAAESSEPSEQPSKTVSNRLQSTGKSRA